MHAHPGVLTPHAVAPLAGAGRVARELNLLQAGTHNAGFVAVSDTPGAREFLDWWQRRLSTHCRFDNGAAVSERARRLYRDMGEAVEEFGDPLKTAHANSYYRWLGRQSSVLSEARLAVRGLWGGVRRSLRRWARASEGP